MFSFIKNKLQKVYSQFTTKVWSLFAREKLDAQTLHELELLLIGADTGVKTTRIIIARLQDKFNRGELQAGADLQKALEQELLAILATKHAQTNCSIYLLVGINGSGKTTFAGKLAYALSQQHKKVLLVAADTFRAAAP